MFSIIIPNNNIIINFNKVGNAKQMKIIKKQGRTKQNLAIIKM